MGKIFISLSVLSMDKLCYICEMKDKDQTPQSYKNCKFCNKLFLVAKYREKQTFCSKSCTFYFYNKALAENPEIWKQKMANRRSYNGAENPNYQGGGVQKTCIHCNSIFNVAHYNIRGNKHLGMYCSLKCCRAHKTKNAMSKPQKKLKIKYKRIFCRIVKSYSTKTADAWLSIFGYTKQELLSHLENLFTDGMNWDNYGKWHIDHVVPVSAFNFENESDKDFINCWSLKNLQPLWAKDNLIKSGMNKKSNKLLYGK